jgi:hypothetical protein
VVEDLDELEQLEAATLLAWRGRFGAAEVQSIRWN